MRKLVLFIGQWISILAAVVSSFWLLFGQLYVIQFALLAYVLAILSDDTLIKQRPKFPSWLFVTLAVAVSLITIWMIYRTEMGFEGGNHHYGSPNTATIFISVVDVGILILTLRLYKMAISKTK